MTEQLDQVDRALTAWRHGKREQKETLSGPARSALFARVSSAQGVAPAGFALFPPLRRWALAAGIPLALTLGLAWLGQKGGVMERSETRIQASKQGEEVVFTIADGRRQHQVLRSDSPKQFDRTSAIQVRNGGSFRQDADSGPDLVFYRID
jgi:hypothetical protein